jgi:hypothetical protein
MGLLDPKRPPTSVFSAEEIARLAPPLRTAFQRAQASEWISFLFSYPTGTNLEITSGAFFIKDRRLHVVIANTREVVQQFSKDIELVRVNPLRSIRGMHGYLTFDPARFIADTRSNWAGSSNASASELVLDYREIHSLAAPLFPPPGTASPESAPRGCPPPGPATAAGGATALSDLARENLDLNAQVQRLEIQIETLTRRLKEQESIASQLRQDIDALRSTKPRKDPRPSP